MKYITILLLLALSACTPLYFPPVPARLELEKTTSLSNSQGLLLIDKQLQLSLNLASVATEDWLAVQWFTPNNKQISSDAIWIDPTMAGETIVFLLDENIEINTGLWRVVVSFDNALLRQFVKDIALE